MGRLSKKDLEVMKVKVIKYLRDGMEKRQEIFLKGLEK